MHLDTNKKLIKLIFILLSILVFEILGYSYLLSLKYINNTDNQIIETDNTDNIIIEYYSDNQVIYITSTPYNTPIPTIIKYSVEITPTNLVNSPTTTISQPTSTPIPTPEIQSAYVAFYSDPQSDTDSEDVNHQTVVNNILAKGANPVFNAGDLMEDGTQASLDRFNAVTTTLRSSRTFYSALGNNDRVEGDASTPSPLYLNNFSFPNNERWYSINSGNLHMVILDSAFASTSQTQKDWLQADLQSANSQDRITGVMFHHPTHASTISSYLVNNNVDFVVMGHEHSFRYYDSNGIDHFVSSGQTSMGYFTLRVYESYATLSVYNSSNGLVGTYNINDR